MTTLLETAFCVTPLVSAVTVLARTDAHLAKTSPPTTTQQTPAPVMQDTNWMQMVIASKFLVLLVATLALTRKATAVSLV